MASEIPLHPDSSLLSNWQVPRPYFQDVFGSLAGGLRPYQKPEEYQLHSQTPIYKKPAPQLIELGVQQVFETTQSLTRKEFLRKGLVSYSSKFPYPNRGLYRSNTRITQPPARPDVGPTAFFDKPTFPEIRPFVNQFSLPQQLRLGGAKVRGRDLSKASVKTEAEETARYLNFLEQERGPGKARTIPRETLTRARHQRGLPVFPGIGPVSTSEGILSGTVSYAPRRSWGRSYTFQLLNPAPFQHPTLKYSGKDIWNATIRQPTQTQWVTTDNFDPEVRHQPVIHSSGRASSGKLFGGARITLADPTDLPQHLAATPQNRAIAAARHILGVDVSNEVTDERAKLYARATGLNYVEYQEKVARHEARVEQYQTYLSERGRYHAGLRPDLPKRVKKPKKLKASIRRRATTEDRPGHGIIRGLADKTPRELGFHQEYSLQETIPTRASEFSYFMELSRKTDQRRRAMGDLGRSLGAWPASAPAQKTQLQWWFEGALPEERKEVLKKYFGVRNLHRIGKDKPRRGVGWSTNLSLQTNPMAGNITRLADMKPQDLFYKEFKEATYPEMAGIESIIREKYGVHGPSGLWTLGMGRQGKEGVLGYLAKGGNKEIVQFYQDLGRMKKGAAKTLGYRLLNKRLTSFGTKVGEGGSSVIGHHLYKIHPEYTRIASDLLGRSAGFAPKGGNVLWSLSEFEKLPEGEQLVATDTALRQMQRMAEIRGELKYGRADESSAVGAFREQFGKWRGGKGERYFEFRPEKIFPRWFSEAVSITADRGLAPHYEDSLVFKLRGYQSDARFAALGEQPRVFQKVHTGRLRGRLTVTAKGYSSLTQAWPLLPKDIQEGISSGSISYERKAILGISGHTVRARNMLQPPTEEGERLLKSTLDIRSRARDVFGTRSAQPVPSTVKAFLQGLHTSQTGKYAAHLGTGGVVTHTPLGESALRGVINQVSTMSLQDMWTNMRFIVDADASEEGFQVGARNVAGRQAAIETNLTRKAERFFPQLSKDIEKFIKSPPHNKGEKRAAFHAALFLSTQKYKKQLEDIAHGPIELGPQGTGKKLLEFFRPRRMRYTGSNPGLKRYLSTHPKSGGRLLFPERIVGPAVQYAASLMYPGNVEWDLGDLTVRNLPPEAQKHIAISLGDERSWDRKVKALRTRTSDKGEQESIEIGGDAPPRKRGAGLPWELKSNKQAASENPLSTARAEHFLFEGDERRGLPARALTPTGKVMVSPEDMFGPLSGYLKPKDAKSRVALRKHILGKLKGALEGSFEDFDRFLLSQPVETRHQIRLFADAVESAKHGAAFMEDPIAFGKLYEKARHKIVDLIMDQTPSKDVPFGGLTLLGRHTPAEMEAKLAGILEELVKSGRFFGMEVLGHVLEGVFHDTNLIGGDLYAKRNPGWRMRMPHMTEDPSLGLGGTGQATPSTGPSTRPPSGPPTSPRTRPTVTPRSNRPSSAPSSTTRKMFRGERFFLSNFYHAASMGFPTSEQAYVAQKLDPTLSPEVRQGYLDQIRRSTPSGAKRLGTSLPLRKDWETHKVVAMWGAISSKFSPNPMRQKLLGTGSEELVEWNPWGDRYWGRSLKSEHEKDPGKNILGRLLMMLRDTFRKGDDPEKVSRERILSVLSSPAAGYSGPPSGPSRPGGPTTPSSGTRGAPPVPPPTPIATPGSAGPLHWQNVDQTPSTPPPPAASAERTVRPGAKVATAFDPSRGLPWDVPPTTQFQRNARGKWTIAGTGKFASRKAVEAAGLSWDLNPIQTPGPAAPIVPPTPIAQRSLVFSQQQIRSMLGGVLPHTRPTMKFPERSGPNFGPPTIRATQRDQSHEYRPIQRLGGIGPVTGPRGRHYFSGEQLRSAPQTGDLYASAHGVGRRYVSTHAGVESINRGTSETADLTGQTRAQRGAGLATGPGVTMAGPDQKTRRMPPRFRPPAGGPRRPLAVSDVGTLNYRGVLAQEPHVTRTGNGGVSGVPEYKGFSTEMMTFKDHLKSLWGSIWGKEDGWTPKKLGILSLGALAAVTTIGSTLSSTEGQYPQSLQGPQSAPLPPRSIMMPPTPHVPMPAPRAVLEHPHNRSVSEQIAFQPRSEDVDPIEFASVMPTPINRMDVLDHRKPLRDFHMAQGYNELQRNQIYFNV